MPALFCVFRCDTNWDLREASGSTPVSSVVTISALQRICSLCAKRRNMEIIISDCLFFPFPTSGLTCQPGKTYAESH